jgi:hypothetical protein
LSHTSAGWGENDNEARDNILKEHCHTFHPSHFQLLSFTRLQGEGKNENEARDDARKDPDRIYRYATYNDLGGDIVKTPSNIRETLGGSSAHPYPR